jgi:ABC-type iron transport system FetAB permease component
MVLLMLTAASHNVAKRAKMRIGSFWRVFLTLAIAEVEYDKYRVITAENQRQHIADDEQLNDGPDGCDDHILFL